MKFTIAALLVILIAGAAFAQSTSQSRCYWRRDGIYVCESHAETPYGTADTICASGATSACSTRTTPKEPLNCNLPTTK